jgi:hypothetical protein
VKKISVLKDNVIGVEYSLVLANAKNTSDKLKDTFSSMGIDYNEFNSDYCDDNTSYWKKPKTDSVNKPPSEIYEYQNFFLLRKEDGNLILLDGFRRLLWYNTPDQDILVRIYDKKNMTDKEVLQILIHLNHTKFFGGIGNYFDRGFSLALNSIFGLKILKYSKVFDAYVSKNSLIREYSVRGESSGEDKNQEILNRILSDKFIEDMRFVQDLLDNDIMLNSNFGVLLWTIRQENPDFVFSSKQFVEKCKENKYIKENYSKYLKVGDGTSAESQKAINRMIELYTAVFNEMLGKEVEKSYLELKEETKSLLAKLKKNKNLYKITDTKKSYQVERDIFDLLKKNNGFSPKMSVVVHPYDDSKAFAARESKDTLPSGLYEDFYLESITEFSKNLGGTSYLFLFVNKDRTVKIRRSSVSHGYYSFSDNYDGVEIILDEKFVNYNKEFRNQDADVFINTVEFTDKKVQFIDRTKK